MRLRNWMVAAVILIFSSAALADTGGGRSGGHGGPTINSQPAVHPGS